jgi:hypothetical protein
VSDLAVVAGRLPEPDADRQWVCVGCRARVAMAEDVCTSCGRPFAEGLTGATLSPGVAGDDAGGPSTSTGTRAGGYRWALLVRELVVLNVLFVIWRVVGRMSLFHEAGALARGRWIWRLERAVHLPSEAALQRSVLPHATLSRVLNGYYAYTHAAMLVAVLLWLLIRHRDLYPRWRNLVVAFTGICLLIGFIPVAPPRLVPGLGMVDLAARYHQSVYGGLGSGITDQLSTVPSVHVGWAVLVAAAVICVSRSRLRWLAVAYPLVTTYVVIVTANHYWLDGFAALLVLAGVVFVGRRLRPNLVP